MKKIIPIVLLVALVLWLVGSGRVWLNDNASCSVVYDYNGIIFEDTLTDEETEAVIDILDGKKQKSVLTGVPSCGFSYDVAIVVGGKRYALACDKCGVLQNCHTGRLVYVSDEERVVLEEIFTSRGGVFPCV